jgi:hypothetical protein
MGVEDQWAWEDALEGVEGLLEVAVRRADACDHHRLHAQRHYADPIAHTIIAVCERGTLGQVRIHARTCTHGDSRPWQRLGGSCRPRFVPLTYIAPNPHRHKTEKERAAGMGATDHKVTMYSTITTTTTQEKMKKPNNPKPKRLKQMSTPAG